MFGGGIQRAAAPPPHLNQLNAEGVASVHIWTKQKIQKAENEVAGTSKNRLHIAGSKIASKKLQAESTGGGSWQLAGGKQGESST
jgi:hypothetical protein